MTVHGLMWDSTTPELIPGWARLKALYVNGKYAQFPRYGRGHVYIDVTGAAPMSADILDVERGDATPATVLPWLRARSHWDAGTIYCNRDTLPAVQDAAGDLPFHLWLATLDGTIPESVTGPGHLVAVQAYPASVVGVNIDVSVVLDAAWWAGKALPAVVAA